MTYYDEKFTEDPRFILAKQRWQDATAAASIGRRTLRDLDSISSQRYREWQNAIATIRDEQPKSVQEEVPADGVAWGWSMGNYTYGNLRDMLSAAGYEDCWDLTTTREKLEKLIHTHLHVSVAHPKCPACVAEKNKP